MTESIFHLAIPCLDLDSTVDFYCGVLGCRLARRYEDRVTFEFFGAQLVCHLSTKDEIPAVPKIYPRHFGLTLEKKAKFDELVDSLMGKGVDFHTAPFVRFEKKREEHKSFFLKDPANNLIEFKWYRDPEMKF